MNHIFVIIVMNHENNNKYMIASTQITSTEFRIHTYSIFFKLLSRKNLFINRKTIQLHNCTFKLQR